MRKMLVVFILLITVGVVSFAQQNTPPLAPRNFRADTPGTGNVTLRWDNAGSGISYRLFYLEQNDPSRAIEIMRTDKTSENIPLPSGTYYFWVSSLRNGQESGKSAVVIVHILSPAPPTPQNLRVNTHGSDSVTLWWDSAGSGISYRVYFNTSDDPSNARELPYTTDISMNISGLIRNTTYYFWVSSLRDEQESEKSPMVSAKTPSPSRSSKILNSSNIWSTGLDAVGASIGTSFSVPAFIGTIKRTFAPATYWYAEGGIDLGLGSKAIGSSNEYPYKSYFSLCPFAHTGVFVPLLEKNGWYLGGGGGYFYARHNFDDGLVDFQTFVVDINTGFIFSYVFEISYTFRTNFKEKTNKLSVGAIIKL